MLKSELQQAKARDGQETLTSLITGLLDDLKRLVQLEVKLAKDELLLEVSKVKQAAIATGIGIGLLAVAGLLLLIMLVHMVQAFTGLPLWASYGIVGGLLALGGGFALMRAKRQAKDIDFVPERTLQTLKEDAQWMASEARSVKR